LVGYLNEKNLNPKNYYYAYYNDHTLSDEELMRNMNWNDPYEILYPSQGHHEHGHGHHEHSQQAHSHGQAQAHSHGQTQAHAHPKHH
jgi:hypothetical protein